PVGLRAPRLRPLRERHRDGHRMGRLSIRRSHQHGPGLRSRGLAPTAGEKSKASNECDDAGQLLEMGQHGRCLLEVIGVQFEVGTMISWVCALPFPRFTDAGAKRHEYPSGSPLHASCTTALKPFFGDSESCTPAVSLPASMLVLDAVSEKSASPR